MSLQIVYGTSDDEDSVDETGDDEDGINETSDDEDGIDETDDDEDGIDETDDDEDGVDVIENVFDDVDSAAEKEIEDDQVFVDSERNSPKWPKKLQSWKSMPLEWLR